MRFTTDSESNQKKLHNQRWSDDRVLEVRHNLESQISRCDFKQILRSENNHADSLTTLAIVVNFQSRPKIPVEDIKKPSIHNPDEEVLWLDLSLGWRDPIISFLKDGMLPDDKAKAQKL